MTDFMNFLEASSAAKTAYEEETNIDEKKMKEFLRTNPQYKKEFETFQYNELRDKRMSEFTGNVAQFEDKKTCGSGTRELKTKARSWAEKQREAEDPSPDYRAVMGSDVVNKISDGKFCYPNQLALMLEDLAKEANKVDPNNIGEVRKIAALQSAMYLYYATKVKTDTELYTKAYKAFQKKFGDELTEEQLKNLCIAGPSNGTACGSEVRAAVDVGTAEREPSSSYFQSLFGASTKEDMMM